MAGKAERIKLVWPSLLCVCRIRGVSCTAQNKQANNVNICRNLLGLAPGCRELKDTGGMQTQIPGCPEGWHGESHIPACQTARQDSS